MAKAIGLVKSKATTKFLSNSTAQMKPVSSNDRSGSVTRNARELLSTCQKVPSISKVSCRTTPTQKSIIPH